MLLFKKEKQINRIRGYEINKFQISNSNSKTVRIKYLKVREKEYGQSFHKGSIFLKKNSIRRPQLKKSQKKNFLYEAKPKKNAINFCFNNI